MKKIWTDAELGEHWTLSDDDRVLLKGKTGTGRLALAIQLKHYQLYNRFPEQLCEIVIEVREFIGFQVDTSADDLATYDDNGRASRKHRQQILAHLKVVPFDECAEVIFRKWLIDEALPDAPDRSNLDDQVTEWLREKRFEPPGGYRLERIVNSAGRAFEEQLFAAVSGRLNDASRARLDALLEEMHGTTGFTGLRVDMGPVSLGSVLNAIDRLEALRAIGIPGDILHDLNPKLVKRYRQRAATENAWELRRHPPQIRYPLLVFYCVPREGEIIDGLVDLLIQVIHKISARAEQKIIKELIKSITKVHGKTSILFHIAEAVMGEPDGVVRDVIFPVASEDTIVQLVKEFRSSGPAYAKKIYTKIRSSYAQHYRRMLPRILEVLDFRSNNAAWRPILGAIDVIKAHQDERTLYFSVDEVPVDGVVRNKWREIVVEKAPDGTERINRINYEICVLQALREKLRCKEIWVVGADRFRNPDQDVPTDFDKNREGYYSQLGWPLDAANFVMQIKGEMTDALGRLNANLPQNRKVEIKRRGKKAFISVTPLTAQPEPPNLEAMKGELGQRWPSTSLLDVLKETNFTVGFTKAFSSAASREAVDPNEVLRRLLLSLYGLGTNAGLKRVASGRLDVSYKELLHTHRRYINKDSLRDAIRLVVNAIFEARQPEIWGEGTTACASDSTQFGAWDQNLMTEWHMRYGGRGVMIYWHVDDKACCIHSQLKRCSSSEVASMIEGVLHHCTEMEVDRQYVDTHGQSVVAFAFCHLLGFSLMPRFKGIDKQKLALPETGVQELYPNLEPIFMTKAINWELIAQQYDELIKFATALRERTAEPEAILRRFTRTNTQHPTYAALIELGKVVKTIFLCEYLSSEDLRREINSGLNVIERWNGVNNFIYFGKGGEMATNRLEDQEVSVLALHLLQISMVYVNTLMIQQILSEPAWRSRMTERDMAALNPLPHGHLNPYGFFDLNMKERLPIDVLSVSA